MTIKVFSAAPVGLDSTLVEVEVDIGKSLPNILIVGLPDAAVQEARERVRAAIKNSGLKFPINRVTVNLAPGHVKKEGPAYDLPVALAVLAAAEELPGAEARLAETLVLGELALDGSLRPIRSSLSAAVLAKRLGVPKIVVPLANAEEAALVEGVEVLGAENLRDVVRHFIGEVPLSVTHPGDPSPVINGSGIDFATIRGQHLAKRAMEIAAAGSHNVLLRGSPGAGKTLLARALATILPPMTKEEVLEATSVWSAAGLLHGHIMNTRPFRCPHHTTSHVALIGGGTSPRPGEVSLAHRGVLFLDEFPEFPRRVLEVLRQPLEDGVVHVARAAGTVSFPARFILVAAQNPCPCGYADDPVRECTCPPTRIAEYKRRVSGPLLDRIDLHVVTPRLSVDDLSLPSAAETSAQVRERVVAARQKQAERFKDTKIVTNSEMSGSEARRLSNLSSGAEKMLALAIDKLGLSARAYYRLIKVARTIADLNQHEGVEEPDIAESLQFRHLEE